MYMFGLFEAFYEKIILKIWYRENGVETVFHEDVENKIIQSLRHNLSRYEGQLKRNSLPLHIARNLSRRAKLQLRRRFRILLLIGDGYGMHARVCIGVGAYVHFIYIAVTWRWFSRVWKPPRIKRSTSITVCSTTTVSVKREIEWSLWWRYWVCFDSSKMQYLGWG